MGTVMVTVLEVDLVRGHVRESIKEECSDLEMKLHNLLETNVIPSKFTISVDY